MNVSIPGPVSPGVSVKRVTLCSDVSGARKEILLSCCFKEDV